MIIISLLTQKLKNGISTTSLFQGNNVPESTPNLDLDSGMASTPSLSTPRKRVIGWRKQALLKLWWEAPPKIFGSQKNRFIKSVRIII